MVHIVLTDQSAAFAFSAAIDADFGYPKSNVVVGGGRRGSLGQTTRYADLLKHNTLNQWAYPEEPVIVGKEKAVPIPPGATRQTLDASWSDDRTVLPMGDSITVGIGSSDGTGYRYGLFQSSISAGKPIDFVGASVEVVGPTPPSSSGAHEFSTSHAGYGGKRTYEVASVANDSLRKYLPRVVLLHVGTNDLTRGIADDIVNAPAHCAALLDQIHAVAPFAFVVVAKIIPTWRDDWNMLVDNYNSALVGIAASRATFCTLVDMNGPFVANPSYKSQYMVDSYHPSDAGYAVMASVWHAAMG